MYLDAKAHSVVLFGCLDGWSLLLLKGLFCLSVIASHEVFVGFPFRLLQDFKEER